MLLLFLLVLAVPVLGENLGNSVTNRENPPLSNLSPPPMSPQLAPSLEAQLRRELDQIRLPVEQTAQVEVAPVQKKSLETSSSKGSFTDLDPYF
jgi:cell envelope opacity-associated protein A